MSRADGLSAILFYGALFVLGWLVFLIFQPFLVPLGWASVLAVVFYGHYQRLARHWGPTRAAAAGTAGVTLILIVPALFLMLLFAREATQAIQTLRNGATAGQFEWVNRIWNRLAVRLGDTETNLPAMLQRGAENVASFLAARLGTVVRNIAVFLFELFVALFALFFFFRDGEAILAFVRRIQPFEERSWERMLTQTRELIHASVAVTALIAAIQGCLGGIAFAIVGIGSAVFWGVLMAFLSLLPVVGSWPVWVPAAVWLFATGHVARGAVLVGICLGLVGTIDNFMRPYLMSGHARLNALLVFISVLGGIMAFGLLGVVLGPIVVAAAMSLLDVHRRPELEA
jgi:predicted PurR-regulated permease PerM